MALLINDLRKLCTDDTIIMTAHVIKRCKERNIDSDSIIKVIMQGEIIKQYEDDKPFPSCLLLGLSINGKYLKGALNMNCFTCGSNHMIEATTIYVEKLENGILIVKNVPCKKCSQCGEEFFSMATMKEIEKLSKQAEKIISEVMIIDYNKAA